MGRAPKNTHRAMRLRRTYSFAIYPGAYRWDTVSHQMSRQQASQTPDRYAFLHTVVRIEEPCRMRQQLISLRRQDLQKLTEGRPALPLTVAKAL